MSKLLELRKTSTATAAQGRQNSELEAWKPKSLRAEEPKSLAALCFLGPLDPAPAPLAVAAADRFRAARPRWRASPALYSTPSEFSKETRNVGARPPKARRSASTALAHPALLIVAFALLREFPGIADNKAESEQPPAAPNNALGLSSKPQPRNHHGRTLQTSHGIFLHIPSASASLRK